jgi:translation initiation factor IF-3
VGIVPLDEARRTANDAGLDLVEVAPDARPIVVRVMDWGKHRFEANKKAREARKKEARVQVKQVKLRPNINIHDLQTKLNHARRFLREGDKVKVTIMFRGRDMRRPENGRKLLARVIELLDEVAQVESAPGAIVNRDMNMVLGPKKGVVVVKEVAPPRDPSTKPQAREAAAKPPATAVAAKAPVKEAPATAVAAKAPATAVAAKAPVKAAPAKAVAAKAPVKAAPAKAVAAKPAAKEAPAAEAAPAPAKPAGAKATGSADTAG